MANLAHLIRALVIWMLITWVLVAVVLIHSHFLKVKLIDAAMPTRTLRRTSTFGRVGLGLRDPTWNSWCRWSARWANWDSWNAIFVPAFQRFTDYLDGRKRCA